MGRHTGGAIMKNLKRIGNTLTNWLCVMILIWGVLSYGEILCKNVRPNPQYSNWNLIMMIFDK